MPLASAYSISSSRVQTRSRSGAIDLHARVVRLERELEAELVVALPGAAVNDGLGAELERDLRDRPGDDRARERRHERVLALVERVRDDRPRALLVRERVLAIDEQDVVGVRGRAACDRLVEVELLADVDEDRDHLVEAVPVLLEPRDDAARVEASRVGDDGSRSCCALQQIADELVPQSTGRRAVPNGDEDRVVARHGAGDPGMARLVDRLREGVRVAGGSGDDERARPASSTPTAYRRIAAPSARRRSASLAPGGA